MYNITNLYFSMSMNVRIREIAKIDKPNFKNKNENNKG
jgi:hypothetical protein